MFILIMSYLCFCHDLFAILDVMRQEHVRVYDDMIPW